LYEVVYYFEFIYINVYISYLEVGAI
jgi:hypothetical protein